MLGNTLNLYFKVQGSNPWLLLVFQIMMQKLKNLNITSCEQHPFHLVDPSPWPIMVSLSIFLLTLSTVCCFHYTESASELFMGSFLALVFFLIR